MIYPVSKELAVCLLYILSLKLKAYIQLSASPGQQGSTLHSIFSACSSKAILELRKLTAFYGNIDLPVSHVLRMHLHYESVIGFGELHV